MLANYCAIPATGLTTLYNGAARSVWHGLFALMFPPAMVTLTLKDDDGGGSRDISDKNEPVSQHGTGKYPEVWPWSFSFTAAPRAPVLPPPTLWQAVRTAFVRISGESVTIVLPHPFVVNKRMRQNNRTILPRARLHGRRFLPPARTLGGGKP